MWRFPDPLHLLDAEVLKAMGRYLNFLGLVFCLVLGQASAALATDYEFTTIDFPGAHFSETLGINNVGDVVGAYGAGGPEHGFLLSRGTFSTIDVPGIVGTEENAAGINNRGEIAGEYNDGQYHGYLVSDGNFTLINVPGASDTFARGINAAGQVVGQYVAAGISHGFSLSRGTFTPIDIPGATGVVPYGINAAGQIAGTVYGAGAIPSAFVRNQDGTVTTIALPGAASTYGFAINSKGNIVGMYQVVAGGPSYPFVFSGSFETLDVPGAVNGAAHGINSKGQIVGYFDTPEGKRHGFIATPQ